MALAHGESNHQTVNQNRLAASIVEYLEGAYTTLTLEDKPAVHDFVLDFTAGITPRNQTIRAIIYYGSCLHPDMTRPSSTPDYFVVVDSYRDFHHKRRHVWMNHMLPPSIYRHQQSKYSVISFADLKRETSKAARDVYVCGRFSKYLAIAYTRNVEDRDSILQCCANAMIQVLRRSLALHEGEISLSAIILAALKLSYLGEVRVEADDKVEKIYTSQEAFYRTAFGTLLKKMAAELDWVEWCGKPSFAGQTRLRVHPPLRERRITERFLRASRIRACLRWPKLTLTVENWIDYINAKIERAQGVRIEVSETERRWPAIYVWKYIWKLRKLRLLK